VLECVANVAEGRRPPVISALATSAGASLRDVHSDADHHRSVFTLIDEAEPLARSVRSLATATLEALDLSRHDGAHPRLGVLDVVPFVALDPTASTVATELRDDTARWIADEFSLPVFVYGPLADGRVRALPDIRRRAFSDLRPDFGPTTPHPHFGATCVGARPILVAWNLWLTGVSVARARAVAASLRRPAVRALAFELGPSVQISCNVIDVDAVGLSELFDEVARHLAPSGGISRAELVGLAPRSVLAAEDPSRWDQLGLSESATIEARLGI
jgi:glutamate formiminotransferase / 5-formyltetrahydrofolate cyclo-ligase